jgi:hypothetical protein
VLVGDSDVFFCNHFFSFVIDDFLKQTCWKKTPNCICKNTLEIEYVSNLETFIDSITSHKPDILVIDETFNRFADENQKKIISQHKNKIISIGYTQSSIYNKSEIFKLFFDNLRKQSGSCLAKTEPVQFKQATV